MTEAAHAERMRHLQDVFLSLPVIRDRIRWAGEEGRIHGEKSPTYREVADFVQPLWSEWFAAFIADHDPPAGRAP
jgi:hypothetical protein